MRTNIPALISFDDYHEITYFEEHLRKVLPDTGVFEIGSACRYYGLVYIEAFPPSADAVMELLVLEFGVSSDLPSKFLRAYEKYVL